MKNYTITVNGIAYDVTVEETDGTSVSSPSAPAAGKTPRTIPAAACAPAVSSSGTGAGHIQVKSGAAGKVIKIEAAAGTSVKKGDTVIIIEAMKMEIPVVAPEDGTIATVECKIGDSIDGGAVLATLN